MNDMTPAATVPRHHPNGQECALFRAANAARQSLLPEGLTGCGKTLFVEHMVARTDRNPDTLACHDDLSAAGPARRYLLKGGGTACVDGLLTRAAREGAICWLDEVTEARTDVAVALHPSTDDRSTLMIDHSGGELQALTRFMLIASCNPGQPLHPPGTIRHRLSGADRRSGGSRRSGGQKVSQTGWTTRTIAPVLYPFGAGATATDVFSAALLGSRVGLPVTSAYQSIGVGALIGVPATWAFARHI